METRYQGVKSRTIGLGWESREGDDERRSAERAAPSAYVSEGAGVIRLDERRYSMDVSFSQTQSTTLRVIHASPRLATTTRASASQAYCNPVGVGCRFDHDVRTVSYLTTFISHVLRDPGRSVLRLASFVFPCSPANLEPCSASLFFLQCKGPSGVPVQGFAVPKHHAPLLRRVVYF